MKIAIVANTSWYLYNFRINQIKALMKLGHDIIVIGDSNVRYIDCFRTMGISYYPLSIAGDSINPVSELLTLYQLYKIIKTNNTDLILSNTPKINIYSCLVGQFAKKANIPNVSGLGRTFIRKSPITLLMLVLYRASFTKAPRVFFQNQDDKQYFIKQKLISDKQAVLIPGSGIDLQKFKPISHNRFRQPCKKFVFLLMGRLLWDKGIGEYVEAAKLVLAQRKDVEFLLLGEINAANPSAIQMKTVECWQKQGIVNYLGQTDNVIPYIQTADCIVLPSYREGTSRSLLEAAAMGKPIIATDVPGCRNVVNHGTTGYLCKPRNPLDLADKMQIMLSKDNSSLIEMGLAGRQKVELEFDEQEVINKYVNTIDALFGQTAIPAFSTAI